MTDQPLFWTKIYFIEKIKKEISRKDKNNNILLLLLSYVQRLTVTLFQAINFPNYTVFCYIYIQFYKTYFKRINFYTNMSVRWPQHEQVISFIFFNSSLCYLLCYFLFAF